LHYLDSGPITAIADRWINRYHRHRAHVLADVKFALESNVSDTEFVYTTYIRTTPERLWQALREPEFTKDYWGVTFASDWTVDAPMTWEEKGAVTTDPRQRVLVCEPYRRLSYTWHTFTPEWAAANGIDDATLGRLAAEPRSAVTFDLEPAEDGVVKLTVIHGRLDPNGMLREMIGGGWPRLLADLKSLLENGQPLILDQPPVMTTDMLIRRPATEVYEAFADPAVTTNFWFTKSSGRLDPGARVRWDWEMFDLHTYVTVREAEAGRRLLFEWNPDRPSTVGFTFTPEGDNATYVQVTETDLKGTGDEMVAYAIGSTSGFSKVLAAAKAWLEHGIALNVVADHKAEGH